MMKYVAFWDLMHGYSVEKHGGFGFTVNGFCCKPRSRLRKKIWHQVQETSYPWVEVPKPLSIHLMILRWSDVTVPMGEKCNKSPNITV